MKSIIFLIVVLCLIGNASADTYYVTHDAPGGGSGNWSSPWTITEGFDGAIAGDTIKIQGGEYLDEQLLVNNSGNATHRITFTGDNGTANIDGYDVGSDGVINTNSNTYITINDITIHNSSFGIKSSGDHVNITNNTVHTISQRAIETGGVSYNNVSQNTIYDTAVGIMLGAGSNHTATENTIYNHSQYGIQISLSSNCTLDSNVIYDGVAGSYDYRINDGVGYNIPNTKIISTYFKLNDFNIYLRNTGSGAILFENTLNTVSYDLYPKLLTTLKFSDFPAYFGDLIDFDVTAGTIDQLNVSGLDVSTKHWLYYDNNDTVIEVQTSDASAHATFTTNLTTGEYIVTDAYNPFSNMEIVPLTVRENEPFTVNADVDGTVSAVIVKISGDNYTMSNTVGDTWSYTFVNTSIPTEYYVQKFYAQDGTGNWNEITSSLTIMVTSSTGTGGGAITPTPEPTVEPEPTAEPTVEPETEEPIVTVPDITFPSVSPSNGGYEVTILKTHVTVPEFYESPLWEIMIFILGFGAFVGTVIETKVKRR